MALAKGTARRIIEKAREEAEKKHGKLKRGPERWSRLIAEEWAEVEDELQTLTLLLTLNYSELQETREALVAELAQLAQLCEGVMELLMESDDLTEEA